MSIVTPPGLGTLSCHQRFGSNRQEGSCWRLIHNLLWRLDFVVLDELGYLPFTHPQRHRAGKGSARLPYVQAAGFTDVALDDRNDWFRDYARDECERLKD